jgi:hypothetical protein
VYNLVDEDGKVDQRVVLKAAHRHALMTKVKREWEIGLQVRAASSHRMQLKIAACSSACNPTGRCCMPAAHQKLLPDVLSKLSCCMPAV